LIRRWRILIGRTGTILIAAGLALVLLSAIPPRAVENCDFKGTSILQTETFSVESLFYLSLGFDPQRGVYINAEGNRSFTAYLLNMGEKEVLEWITGNYSGFQPASPIFSLSILKELLASHSNWLELQKESANGQVEFQYAPTRRLNVTLIFSNPSTESVKVKYSGKLLNFIVLSERALAPAKFAVPIGLLLATPWLLSTWRRRKIKQENAKPVF
jgi:hypothetical protein